METEALIQTCRASMRKLCVEIPERSVGSEGNRLATRFFAEALSDLGWNTESQPFDAVDWHDGGASLQADGVSFDVRASPYALGCDVEGELVGVSSLAELEKAGIKGKVLLLYGEIAREQLMPKNFVFYNPEEHQRIIALLEQGGPQAIICATGSNPSLAGGVYPFPLIEDGDFDIPSVYTTEEEGIRILPFVGKSVKLRSGSRRIPGQGYNVSGRKGSSTGQRVVVTAHIDAKKGTPGAIDNASGVAVLLLLAELLADYDGEQLIEIVAFNGEDYYAVPGQMMFVQQNQSRFEEILVNINIDGAGYHEGKSAFSFYGLPVDLETCVRVAMENYDGIVEGPQWVQGDHSIFIQFGRPAVAVSSQWFTDNVDSQNITHTPKDNLDIVDCQKLVEIASALNQFIRAC